MGEVPQQLIPSYSKNVPWHNGSWTHDLPWLNWGLHSAHSCHGFLVDVTRLLKLPKPNTTGSCSRNARRCVGLRAEWSDRPRRSKVGQPGGQCRWQWQVWGTLPKKWHVSMLLWLLWSVKRISYWCHLISELTNATADDGPRLKQFVLEWNHGEPNHFGKKSWVNNGKYLDQVAFLEWFDVIIFVYFCVCCLLKSTSNGEFARKHRKDGPDRPVRATQCSGPWCPLDAWRPGHRDPSRAGGEFCPPWS